MQSNWGFGRMKDEIQGGLTVIIQAISSNTKIEDIFLFGSWQPKTQQ